MPSHRNLLVVTSLILWQMTPAQAHNPAYTINSPGVPGAAITLDGIEQAGEWTGATSVSFGGANPLHATLKVLHKADGIYILAVIADSSSNDGDTLNLRFDIDNNSGATTDADDFGVQILRNGQATWGPANGDPNSWDLVPSNQFGLVSGAAGWTVELHLPVGAPSNLNLAVGTIGFYANILDYDNASNPDPTARYAQWPSVQAVVDGIPDEWGNYVFNPQTTFPDIAVADERRDAGTGSYNKISYSGLNSFVAKLANPGGTAIPDATKVRVNLYLAARGIGESWHRIDTATVLGQDCSAATWRSTVVPKSDVCSGSSPLPDITSVSINDVVANTAKYNIQGGLVMNRSGGIDITVASGTSNYVPVIDWNTSAQQDAFFVPVTVNGQTYNRAHACMLGEAIVPNDPNPGDNVHQVNMDFTGVPFRNALKRAFSVGWYGFAKYDPNVGKRMVLDVTQRNMGEAFRFELSGVERIGKSAYAADLRGRLSRPVTATILAGPGSEMGKTLKENLMVLPRAGGDPRGRNQTRGLPPVYVQVRPDSTLWIVNYAFDDKDEQIVDVDGQGPLQPNGPAGLPPARSKQDGRLLVDGAQPGALVASFDDFKTGIAVGEGTEVRVPSGAKYLALAINDHAGGYADNTGTGFRVKIIERPERPAAGAAPAAEVRRAAADERRLAARPVRDLLPQVCVNGYEDTGEKRPIGKHPSPELYRFIGNVCWTITSILPKEGRAPEDRPDPVRR